MVVFTKCTLQELNLQRREHSDFVNAIWHSVKPMFLRPKDMLPSERHNKNLQQHMYKLYQDGEICDLELYSGDGVCFRVHRVVLTASSRYLYNLCVQSTELTSFTLDIKSDVLRVLLKFCYTGKLLLTADRWVDIKDAAVLLQMCNILELLNKPINITSPKNQDVGTSQMIQYVGTSQINQEMGTSQMNQDVGTSQMNQEVGTSQMNQNVGEYNQSVLPSKSSQTDEHSLDNNENYSTSSQVKLEGQTYSDEILEGRQTQENITVKQEVPVINDEGDQPVLSSLHKFYNILELLNKQSDVTSQMNHVVGTSQWNQDVGTSQLNQNVGINQMNGDVGTSQINQDVGECNQSVLPSKSSQTDDHDLENNENDPSTSPFKLEGHTDTCNDEIFKGRQTQENIIIKQEEVPVLYDEGIQQVSSSHQKVGKVNVKVTKYNTCLSAKVTVNKNDMKENAKEFNRDYDLDHRKRSTALTGIKYKRKSSEVDYNDPDYEPEIKTVKVLKIREIKTRSKSNCTEPVTVKALNSGEHIRKMSIRIKNSMIVKSMGRGSKRKRGYRKFSKILIPKSSRKTCPDCNKTFISFVLLQRHQLRVHFTKNFTLLRRTHIVKLSKYTCDISNCVIEKTFPPSSMKFKCKLCPLKFSKYCQFTMHHRKKHKNHTRPVESWLRYCSVKLAMQKLLVPFAKDRKCNSVLDNKEKGYRRVKKERTFKYNYCNKMLLTHYTLETHKRNMHGDMGGRETTHCERIVPTEPLFVCADCNKSNGSLQTLNNHLQECSCQSPKHQCVSEADVQHSQCPDNTDRMLIDPITGEMSLCQEEGHTYAEQTTRWRIDTSTGEMITDAEDLSSGTDEIFTDPNDQEIPLTAVDMGTSCIQVQAVSDSFAGKKDYSKDQCCYFCEKMVKKMARHLVMVHSDESEIALIQNKTKKSTERRMLLDKLRNIGNFNHNVQVLTDGKGMFIVGKRNSHHSSPKTTCLVFLVMYFT